MPLPKPGKDETQDKFIARCIPLVIEDQELDAEDEDQRNQAVAMCYSQWRAASETKADVHRASGRDGGQPRADAEQEPTNQEVDMSKMKAGEQSLEQRTRVIRDAFYTAFPRPKPAAEPAEMWVREIFDGYVIAEGAGEYYRATYSMDDDGAVTFSELEKVEMEYVPAKAAAVKFADEDAGIIEGLAIPYGGPMGGKDLDGEFFSPRTDFALKWFDQRPVLYHHGLDPDAEIEPVGAQFETKTLDAGRWAKVQLDKAHRYYDKIADMVREGKLFFSSGALPHLVRKAASGELTRWPWVELSLTPTPANPYAVTMERSKRHFAAAGLKFFDSGVGEADHVAAGKAGSSGQAKGEKAEGQTEKPALQGATQTKSTEVFDMGNFEKNQELQTYIGQQVEVALAAKAVADAKAKEEEEERQKEIETKAWEMARQMTLGRKIPFPTGQQPAVSGVKDMLLDDERVEPLDLALTYLICNKATIMPKPSDRSAYMAKGVPFDGEQLLKAMAAKALKARDRGHLAAKAMEGFAIKADEVMHSDLTSYGDEWVPTLWSAEMWKKIRLKARILPLFSPWEMPSNPAEYPIQSSGFTIYKVPETEDEAQLVFGANNPFSDSRVTTAKLTFTAGKAGALGYFSAELVEDAIVPLIPELRAQMVDDMAHGVDEILISGDETTGSVNISDYGASIAAASRFLVIDGLRHIPLVGNTANARDGGALTLEDITATRALMGTNGKYGLDVGKLVLIPDVRVLYKLLELDEVVTLDKYGPQATVLTGELARIQGIPIVLTEDYALTDSSGYINNTAGSNTQGSFMIVRTDGVRIGWRRHIKIKVEDVPLADSHYIVATARFDLQAFDTDMVAISYNLTI